MATTPEGKVKAKVKAMLKEYGAYQHWPVQHGYGAACLDCHGCYNGLYFAIETKAPGKRPTPRQAITIEDILFRGGKVLVIGEYKKGQEIGGKGTGLVCTAEYYRLDELKDWLEENAES